MILKHRLIIVHDSKLRTWAGISDGVAELYPAILTCVDKELVGDSWMIHIMDTASKEGRENLQRRENVLKRGRLEKDVCGLSDIRGMEMVVVADVLQRRREC